MANPGSKPTHRPEPHADISLIKLQGFIDLTTSEEVEHLLDSLLEGGRYKIIFDLSLADYVSSSIWGIFLEKIKKIREHNGDLKLINMKPEVLEVYKVLELYRVIPAFDSLGEALAAFQKE